MAVTQIDVVNYGLILAGEKVINSMTDAVKGAKLANMIKTISELSKEGIVLSYWPSHRWASTRAIRAPWPACLFQFPRNCCTSYVILTKETVQ